MTLFLSGPLAGQHLTLADSQQSVVVPIPENPSICDEPLAVEPSSLRTFEYERRNVAFGRLDSAVSVFAPKGWSEYMVDYSLYEYLKKGPSA